MRQITALLPVILRNLHLLNSTLTEHVHSYSELTASLHNTDLVLQYKFQILTVMLNSELFINSCLGAPTSITDQFQFMAMLALTASLLLSSCQFPFQFSFSTFSYVSQWLSRCFSITLQFLWPHKMELCFGLALTAVAKKNSKIVAHKKVAFHEIQLKVYQKQINH